MVPHAPIDRSRKGEQEDGGAMTRRGSLAKLGGLAVAALGGAAWLEAEADASSSATAGPAAVASGLLTCVLSPELTAGPYYLEGDKIRRDIREGRPGVVLDLRTTVLEVSTCKPIKGAAVDVWHCDAGGTYSGFAQEGTEGDTFLRGIQKTNARGVALFRTIYPGWYPGRTVHIHVRVYIGGNTIHTGQLFFPEAVSDAVYARSPYRRRPDRDTLNTTDSIFRNGGSKSVLKLARNGSGYIGAVTMGVQRS
jgi:protocatechuate 3,4-dioxygenase beta subunit